MPELENVLGRVWSVIKHCVDKDTEAQRGGEPTLVMQLVNGDSEKSVLISKPRALVVVPNYFSRRCGATCPDR